MILMTALVTDLPRRHRETERDAITKIILIMKSVRQAGLRSRPAAGAAGVGTRPKKQAAVDQVRLVFWVSFLHQPVERTSLRASVSPWYVRGKRNHKNQWGCFPRIACAAAIILASLSASCTNRDPIRATGIQLGRSLNPDNTVSGNTTRFKPGDTIYAAVLTTGSGSATISARWTYAGRVVGEPRRDVRYRGDAATEFHIQNNVGFPVGDYSVELFVDGVSAGRREFRVEK